MQPAVHSHYPERAAGLPALAPPHCSGLRQPPSAKHSYIMGGAKPVALCRIGATAGVLMTSRNPGMSWPSATAGTNSPTRPVLATYASATKPACKQHRCSSSGIRRNALGYGFVICPMNRMVPDDFSRIRNRNGRFTSVMGATLVFTTPTAVTAAASVPSSFTSR